MLKSINILARTLAILGGVVLISMIALTCISVLGRIINSIGHSDFIEINMSFIANALKAIGPVTGDYELIESGAAIAIFMFLPWCQLNRGHASVELFTSFLPQTSNKLLMIVWEFIFALVIILITWRLYEGMTGKIRNGETTFLLQMPVWWAYAICFVVAILASIVAVFSVWLHVAEAKNSTVMMNNEGSVDHE